MIIRGRLEREAEILPRGRKAGSLVFGVSVHLPWVVFAYLGLGSPDLSTADLALLFGGLLILTLVNVAVGAAYAREDQRLSPPSRRTWTWMILLFNIAVLPYFWWRYIALRPESGPAAG